jgi:Pectinacetylesterase
VWLRHLPAADRRYLNIEKESDMTDIYQRVGVKSSSADDVYAALTTIEGLSAMKQPPTRRRRLMTRRPLTITLVVPALAGLLGACGNASGSAGVASTDEATATTPAATAQPATQPSTTGDSTPADSAPAGTQPVDGEPGLLAFSQCMRDNGVAEFPNPGPDGLIVDGLDIDPHSPRFKAAEEACQDLMPQGDPAAPGGSGSAGESDWENIVPGGDCQCADGSEFSFWERRADPTRVVLFLDGGGSCYDGTSCAFTGTGGENDYYDYSLSTERPMGSGIFDFARAENPFADYSFIYVPLCTGDAYLGDVTREYSPELTVEHNGFVNGTAALGYLAEHYRDATQVVVVGKTSGSVAAPVYGGLVADLLPDAQVTVFGGQSGAFPDDPDFNAEYFGDLWGAYDTMPDWEVNEGLTARDWGPTRFWIQAGLHDPDIVMARFDYAFDQNAARQLEARGIDSSTMVELIDANEATIEAAGVTQHSYTAPGDDHGIFEYEAFYEIEVNGVTLVDWVEALLAGEPLDDVHCTECAAG